MHMLNNQTVVRSVKRQITILLVIAAITGCHNKRSSSQKANPLQDSAKAASITTLKRITPKPHAVSSEHFFDQSVLTVLGDGCGFVTKDDCSYHEKKESSAYRVQCSATHLHWYPDSSTFASMNFLGGARTRDSVYSRVIAIENETIENMLTKVCFIENVPPSYDCPPGVASLGAMLWTMENDKNRYKLCSVNLNIASVGQNGLFASAPERLALKKDRNGYVFTHTAFFQGISETEITVMGIVGSEFRTLLKVITESDNEGACSDPIGCWGYTSTVLTKENFEQSLDDIVITTAGT